MNSQYRQLTQAERYQIEALCKLGFTARRISNEMQRSNKTISNELKRRPDGQYCAYTAHSHAEQIRKHARKHTQCSEVVQNGVKSLLLVGRVLLARKGKRYRPRKGVKAGAYLTSGRVDIDERPAHIEDKIEVRHWEGDTIYG